jgi:uncharacterized protein (DUF983 family)
MRGACPACGLGSIWIAGFRSRHRCDACGWFFERGPGHWIGGSEINMFVTFWVASSVFLVLNWFVGFSWVSLVLAAAFTTGFAFLIHRPCRSVYFALDYIIDPTIDLSHGEGEGDDDGGGDPPPPPLPPGLTHGAPDGSLRGDRISS